MLANLGEQAILISIHAPARGATLTEKNRLHQKIFQFTPLREGRLV